MTTTIRRPDTHEPTLATAGRRFGYVVGAVVNVGLLYVANHLLEWGWPEFLTGDFERVLPILNVSLVAGIAVNAAYVAYDTPWFQAAGQVCLGLLSLLVTARIYSVFPFDFSGYARDWTGFAKVVLIVVMVAVAVGLVAETVKLGVRLARIAGSPPPAGGHRPVR